MPRKYIKRPKRSPRRAKAPRSVKQAKINSLVKNSEVHLYQTAISQSITDISEQILSLTEAIGQGDTQYSRQGKKITGLSLHYNLKFIYGDTTNVVRFMLLVDKQANAAVKPTNDVLLPITGTQDPLQMRNPATRKRYRVLLDRVLNLSSAGIPQSVQRGIIKLKNLPIDYADSTTTYAEKNNLYAVFISDSGAATHPAVEGYFRLYFLP